jgi:hypothetical protein
MNGDKNKQKRCEGWKVLGIFRGFQDERKVEAVDNRCFCLLVSLDQRTIGWNTTTAPHWY